MSEQDAASVGRYLDRLEAQRGNEANEATDRRIRAAVQRWEYLFFEIGTDDHGKPFVQSSIERYQWEDPPGDIADIVDALGDEGWEMVNCGMGTPDRRFFPYRHLEAVFKRLKTED
jgi:hypothetical protein